MGLIHCYLGDEEIVMSANITREISTYQRGSHGASTLAYKARCQSNRKNKIEFVYDEFVIPTSFLK